MTDHDKPRRRLLDAASGPPTLLGEGSRFEGQLEVPGTLVCSGTVVGAGTIAGTVSVTELGHWQGDIHARAAVIAGRVDGDLDIQDKLEIGRRAVICGNVRATALAIAHGARVDGSATVTGGGAVMRFEERRASRL